MALENGLVDGEVFHAQYMEDQAANRRRCLGSGYFSDCLVDDMAVVAGTQSLLDGSEKPELAVQPIAPRRAAFYDLGVRLMSCSCPADRDEIVEAYVMGTLCAEQAMAFEDHYVVCNSCATVLEKTASYVDAMRTGAKQLRSKPMCAASGSPA